MKVIKSESVCTLIPLFLMDVSEEKRKLIMSDIEQIIDEKSIDIDEKLLLQVSVAEIEDNFEKLWKLYPRKMGKGQVSKSQKKKIYNIGYDEMARCIDRYKEVIKTTEMKYVMHGSTFFNSGYVDFLDANYEHEESVLDKPVSGDWQ